jgi:DNA polymerase/3'-5' exonuclease PolX
MSRIKKQRYSHEYMMSLYNEEERLIRYFCDENDINIINIQHTGSLRRGNKSVGDIDFVIETDNNSLLKEMLKHILNYEKTLHTDFFYKKSAGDIDYDVFIADDGYFWQMAFFLTGCEDWNKKIRSYLLKQQNVKFIYTPFKILEVVNDKPERLKIYSEKDIFNLIELEYVSPENRLPCNVKFKKEKDEKSKRSL